MWTLEDKLLMLIINAAFTLISKFQEQMQKCSQVNGNSKLGHALELNKEITYGQQDTFYKDVQKSIIYQLALNQKFSVTGMDLDATLISQQQRWEKVQEAWHTLTEWWKSLQLSTLSISAYMELITIKDLLVSMKLQVFINFHTEPEIELPHSESLRK